MNETIDIGFFVTFDKEYIRKANNQDDYILGITTATSSILGNTAEMRWKEKYLVDDWGRLQYAHQSFSEVIQKRTILNPKWDPEKKYISRIERSEWVAVGLLGQI
ncbi:exosporium leader peptide, partial [Bacillus anthracis]